MKIQSFKRIVKENLPEESQELAETIGSSVNIFAEDLLNALNKKLSVDDNLSMEYKELEFSVKPNGEPVNLLQYPSSLQDKIRAVSVVRVENLTNVSLFLLSAPFASFSASGRLITITHITGLIPNNRYKVTLLICT